MLQFPVQITFAGSNLYLTELSKKLMQDFAVYFDSNKYKYKEADVFSDAYKANNLKQMKPNKFLN